jgi:hypothetical protein
MSTATKIVPRQDAPLPMAEVDPLISMIERAARDPQVDIDKMERLVAMQERAQARASEQSFNDAMSAAQSEMRRVAADSTNPQTKSNYASYAALDRALRPIYTQHGFSLSFGTEEGAPADCVRVVCHVSNSGYTRKYHIDMPADGKGAKGGDVMTKTHAVGSAATYGQRYLLKMIFNIAVGEDDDGNGAGVGDLIGSEEIIALEKLVKDIGGDRAADLKASTLKYFKAESLAAIPMREYPRVVAALEKKRKA